MGRGQVTGTSLTICIAVPMTLAAAFAAATVALRVKRRGTSTWRYLVASEPRPASQADTRYLPR
jgi:hypothetical protein